MVSSRFSSKCLSSLFLLLLITAPSLFSQITQVTDDQTTPIAGAGHNYLQSANETVNPANGSVSFRYDAGVPKGRGLTVPFFFAYDSNGAVHAVPKSPSPQQAFWTSNNGFGYGGWSYSMPMLSWSARTVTDPHNSYNVCNYVTDFVFQDPTGGRHFLGMLGQLTTSTDCPVLGVPSPTLSGSSDIYSAVATSPAAALVMVIDNTTGTAYSFNTGGLGSQTYTVASFFEDRNGNKVTLNSFGQTITDTLGRLITNNQIPGFTNPYVVTSGMFTSGTHAVNQSADSTNMQYCPSNPILPYGISSQVVTSLTLPNNLVYQFGYDSNSGLLNQITYPNGAWVKYTWGLNSYADHIYVSDTLGDKNVACGYTYDAYAVTERQVSFDGVNVALDQKFAYTTNWSLYVGYKTTTVTSTDETRTPNVITKTIYTYGAENVPNGPYDYFSGQYVAPIEGSVAYQDGSGNTLRTTNKSWSGPSMMTCQSITQNGSTSRTDYNPYALYPWANKKEWDWNQAPACGTNPSGNPLRETDYGQQSFPVQIYPANYWPNSTDPLFGRPTSVTVYGNGTQAAQTTYVYDGGSLASGGVTCPPGYCRDTQYNGNGITARGNATSKSEWVNTTGSSLSWSYTYDDTGQELSMKDPKSHVTDYYFTDAYSSDCYSSGPPGSTDAYLTKIQDAKGFTQTFTYRYCDGQLSTDTDRNNQTASYSYVDSLARLTEIVDADTGTLTNTYNDTGSTPSVVTSQTMDSSNKYVTTKIMDAIGHETRSQLNSDPDCSSSADNTDTAHDGFGRVYTVSNPYCSASPDPHSTGTTTTTYDAVGRTTSVAYADGSTATTSYSANTSTVTDPAGKSRKLTYDGLGRLTAVTEAPGSLNYPTTYGYDALGNLTSATQTSQSRTFLYDSLSRLTRAVNPESGTTHYCYTSSSSACATPDTGTTLCSGDPSEVCRRTDARNITTFYNYTDNLNRLTEKTYSDGTPTANFSYDESSWTLGTWASGTLANPKGRLTHTTTVNSSGTVLTATVQDYDPMGRTTDYWQCPYTCSTNPNEFLPSNYLYKWTGEVYQWTHPAGYTLYNTISAARRITQIQSSLVGTYQPQYPAQSINYTPWGAVSQLVNGDAGSGAEAQETYMYNKRLQPAVIELGTTTNLWAYSCLVYDYYGSSPTSCAVPSPGTNNNGNVRGYLYGDSVQTSFSHTATYTYDNVNRLATAVASPFGTGTVSYNLTYSYDMWGNMTCVLNGQTVGLCSNLSFNTAHNQISTSGYTYDAAGNLTKDSSNLTAHTYQWDAEGRVAAVDPGSSPTWSFTYNALGHRAQWAYGSSGGADQHLFDPAGNWLGNYGEYSLLRLGDRYLVAYESSETYLYHVSALGSASMLTNHAGNAAEDMLFYPWGDVWQSWGTGGYAFANLPYDDTSTNTSITLNRFYSMSPGRWLSPDPIGKAASRLDDPQTWNMYAYVRNNPTTLTDPSGLALDEWWARIAHAVDWISTAELASSAQWTAENPSPPPKPPPGPPAGVAIIKYVNGAPPLSAKVAAELQREASAPGILTLDIGSTTNGTHAVTSNHYEGTAADIDAVNGEPVRNYKISTTLREDTDAIVGYANSQGAHEVFAPGAQIFKNGIPFTEPTVKGQAALVDAHQDHVHIAVPSVYGDK